MLNEKSMQLSTEKQAKGVTVFQVTVRGLEPQRANLQYVGTTC